MARLDLPRRLNMPTGLWLHDRLLSSASCGVTRAYTLGAVRTCTTELLIASRSTTNSHGRLLSVLLQ